MFTPIEKCNHDERSFDTFKAIFEKDVMSMKPDRLLDSTLNNAVNLAYCKHGCLHPRLYESSRPKSGKSNNAIHLCRQRMNLLHPSIYLRPGDGKR
jgi:hypothetical protein